MAFPIPRRSQLDGQLTGNRFEHVGEGGRPATEEREGEEHLNRQVASSTTSSSTAIPPHSSYDDRDQIRAREDVILQLAKTYTEDPSLNRQSPFFAEKDGPLDPYGPNFSGKAWARAFHNLHLQNEDVRPATTGVAFQNLNVHGFGTATDFQKTVGNIYLDVVSFASKLLGKKGHKIQILQQAEGILHEGEMLCVLGPPGSGCSTFLRTLAGEIHGLYVDEKSYVNYQGVTPKEMSTRFRGEAIYTAEADAHFPELSVGDTLYFAACARTPRDIPGGVSRQVYAMHARDVVMATFGISHTVNTRIGDNYIRGVSGGERKRVSIAEAILSGAPLQCWDNSTRGLDSANAVKFCQTLRTQSDVFGTTSCVAIYQAPQEAYDVFDKVLLLYEGRQIFFGKTSEAQRYFEDLGFIFPDRQTTPDFLTSMTSPGERVVRPGHENTVPRTPEDFADVWKSCQQRNNLLQELSKYEEEFPFHGQQVKTFSQSKRVQQAKSQRHMSPYTLSYRQQVLLCLWRGFKLLRGDPSITLTMLVGNFVQFLVVGSVFYNLQQDTDSLFRRGVLIFMAIALNAFASILEILTLYAKRPIVEKHNRYALYHPSAEAIAAMLTDLPYKIVNCIMVNVTVYFMANLNRAAGPFFFYLLVSFLLTLTMSMLFRFMGSSTKTIAQALAPTTIILLAIILFTGFSIPTQHMLGWSRWINYVNPVAYAFESLFINDLHGREFACSTLVPDGPGYQAAGLFSKACNVVGSVPGFDTVSGTRHLLEAYGYKNSHRWRNVGILIAFMIIFMCCYLITSEVIASAGSKGEVLVFQRGRLPAALVTQNEGDIEGGAGSTSTGKKLQNIGNSEVKVKQQTSVLHWKNVCYDVKIKSETRRILDHVDGWVKPGTLTALMGVSGAGKTTLLDTLACRITMGVISGDMLVDGRPRDESFQRKTGYVQQQDLHLPTATVKEALIFSALLRQPASTPHKEKVDYVEEVIDLLEMREYADAVIGELGEGLNVEQRKRLTIGVELAARPQLLLFLDEPTSGLDSQTSWSICSLMEKLVNHGQAILCTIHQPSAMLFQRFDRLLLLAKGGRTVYFGDIGKDSKNLIEYFVRNGAYPCAEGMNPAEWMLEVIGAAPGAKTDIDWPWVWRESSEKRAVQAELDRLERTGQDPEKLAAPSEDEKESQNEFAAPLAQQMFIVTKRAFQQYWRSPSYIYSKAFLSIGSCIFIGFSLFHMARTLQGMRSQMFGVFALLVIFMQIVEQTVPQFVTQRSLYEVRERPSKSYSWKAFMIAQIVVEIPWNTLMAVLSFLCWWFPIGLYKNAAVTNTEHSRATLAFLFVWTFMMLCSTFAHLLIAGISSGETACNIGNVVAALLLVFCGVVATPNAMPGFWIFMYRCNPFTYLVEGLLGVGLARAPVDCAPNELLHFNPAGNQTCGEYLAAYMETAGGSLLNPLMTEDCHYCTISDSDVFLSAINVSYDNRWRNWGLMWAFIMFNATMAVFLYWLMRVPKKSGGRKERKKHKRLSEPQKQRPESILRPLRADLVSGRIAIYLYANLSSLRLSGG